MPSVSHIPVVIGVGDFKNRSTELEDALEPADLMLRAIKLALDDSGLSGESSETLQQLIDSLDVVATWTWPYHDLPGLLSSKLGIEPKRKHYSGHGGHNPAKLFDEAARRIAKGISNVAVLTGGEALASLTACAKAGKLPPPGWTPPAADVTEVFSPTTRDLGSNLGARHKVGAPIQVYPMYENAFRARRGQTIKENSDESAELYESFSRVAQNNPHSWSYGIVDKAQSIGTVTKKNRVICFPYPLLMNAFNMVNIAGACILTSADTAKELGVPESKWIYPLGGAGTSDSANFWERPNYYSSPAISRSFEAAFKVSGITKDDVDFYDFYSCFPIVPKLACDHLGLSISSPAKPITLLGGLTSFGGAGNNYSMHALTESVRRLRSGSGNCGVILANGGVLSYQHVVCLSSRPRNDQNGYPFEAPLPELIKDVRAPKVEDRPKGEAVIETYTVDFKRDGKPAMAHIVGRCKSSGHRFLANGADEYTLQQLSGTSTEPIGRTGWVSQSKQREGCNVFVLKPESNL